MSLALAPSVACNPRVRTLHFLPVWEGIMQVVVEEDGGEWKRQDVALLYHKYKNMTG